MPPPDGGPRTEGGGGSVKLVSGGGPPLPDVLISIRGGGPFNGGGPKSPPVREGTPDGPDPEFLGGLDCRDGLLLDCASNYRKIYI